MQSLLEGLRFNSMQYHVLIEPPFFFDLFMSLSAEGG